MTEQPGHRGISNPGIPHPNIVVGVSRQQPLVVVEEAARLACRLRATLICANADPSRYVTRVDRDGSVESSPIDPDLAEEEDAVFDPELKSRLRDTLNESGRRLGTQLTYEFLELAGDPADALRQLVEVADSDYIVVGSRRAGFGSGMKEFFGGSVAVHLIHHQHRPVLVVPTLPVHPGHPLPWDGNA